MDTATSEKFATALSFMGVIPSFEGDLLFSDDVAEVTRFQIKCEMNDAGRMRFYLVDTPALPEAHMNLAKLYESVHGNKIRTDKRHDINQPNYPTMGADYMTDLSPATIVRLLRVSFENSNELAGILPAFIMRITQEVKRWESHFSILHTKTTTLRKAFEQILEESF